MPLIPGLRVPCWVNPDSGDHQYEETEHDDDLGIHPAAVCPSYTVLSGAEALGVLLEWALLHKGERVVFFRGGSALGRTGCHLEGLPSQYGDTVLEALASAVARAKGVEA